MDKVTNKLAFLGVISCGALVGFVWSTEPLKGMNGSGSPTYAAKFGFCHTGGGKNCVVDGDTAWIDGVKIRVADIDAPETHEPRCSSEAALGRRATERLRALIDSGPFSMRSIDRDEDRYGRKLRILVRDGQSLGDTLVKEGLARKYAGKRRPWC